MGPARVLGAASGGQHHCQCGADGSRVPAVLLRALHLLLSLDVDKTAQCHPQTSHTLFESLLAPECISSFRFMKRQVTPVCLLALQTGGDSRLILLSDV